MSVCKYKADDSEGIEKKDRIVKCTVFWMVAGLAITIGVICFTYLENDQPSNYWEFLGADQSQAVGQLLQATLGLAVQIAAAAVSLILSRNALKLAEQALDVSKSTDKRETRTERREINEYSDKIRKEFSKQSGNFEKKFGNLLSDLKPSLASPFFESLFLARIVCREDLLKSEYVLRNHTLSNAEAEEGVSAEDVVEVIANNPREDSELADLMLRYREATRGHAGVISYQKMLLHSGISAILEKHRAVLFRGLDGLIEAIDSIEEGQFVQYVYEKIADQEEKKIKPLSSLKSAIQATIEAVKDDEAFIVKMAATSIYLRGLDLSPYSFIDEDDVLVDHEPEIYGLCALFIMLNINANGSMTNVYASLPLGNTASNALSVLCDALSRDSKYLASEYNLGVDSDGAALPLPLRGYKPSAYFLEMMRHIKQAKFQLQGVIGNLKKSLQLDDPNAFAVHERFVDHWLALACQRFALQVQEKDGALN